MKKLIVTVEKIYTHEYLIEVDDSDFISVLEEILKDKREALNYMADIGDEELIDVREEVKQVRLA